MDVSERLSYEKDRYGISNWWLDVTDCIGSLFGNAVQKVEVSCKYGYTKEEAITESPKLLEDIKKQLEKENAFDFDAGSMMITFPNGKKILFWNSEWGGAQSIE